MPFPLRITGEHATVEWSYHVAADIGAWVIEWGVLRAQVTTCNPFRLTQAPLYFVAGERFQRQLLNVQVSGQTLTARVGPRRPNAVTNAPTGRPADSAQR